MATKTIEALANSSQDVAVATLREDQDLEVRHSRILMRTSLRTKTTFKICHKLIQSKILSHQKTPLQTSN